MDREKTIAWTMQYCQHYDPSGVTMIGGEKPHGRCKAGVVYLDQFGRAPREDAADHVAAGLGGYYESAGIFSRMCCTDGGKRSEEEQRARCPKWLRSTREQGEQRANDIEASLNRMRVVGPVVSKWRTWTKTNRVAKQEEIDCPTGCGGKLHLSQAALNGHVWGHCTTEGCVSWME